MRVLLLLLALPILPGCICLPDERHGVDWSYFGNCYDDFRNAPRQPVYFPKDAL